MKIPFRQEMIAVDLRKLKGDAQFGVITVGRSGFVVLQMAYPDLRSVDFYVARLEMARRSDEPLARSDVAEMHPYVVPSTQERAAALHGALFGWDRPLASPGAYDPTGKPYLAAERRARGVS